jgi:hypothetical protein
MAEVDSRVGDASLGVESRQKPLRKVQRQAQKLAVVAETSRPRYGRKLEGVICVPSGGPLGFVSQDRELSHGKEVGAEEPADATDDRLKDLNLAVEVKSTSPRSSPSWAFPSIAVVGDELRNTLLEIAQRLLRRVDLVRRRTGKDGKRRKTVYQREGIVAQGVVYANVAWVLSVSR